MVKEGIQVMCKVGPHCAGEMTEEGLVNLSFWTLRELALGTQKKMLV